MNSIKIGFYENNDPFPTGIESAKLDVFMQFDRHSTFSTRSGEQVNAIVIKYIQPKKIQDSNKFLGEIANKVSLIIGTFEGGTISQIKMHQVQITAMQLARIRFILVENGDKKEIVKSMPKIVSFSQQEMKDYHVALKGTLMPCIFQV